MLNVEGIVDAAITLLESTPDTPLSLSATARALGVTPMAIYTHFKDRNALLQAVTERLLRDFPPRDPALLAPAARLRDWAWRMRVHFLAHPQLIHMLNWEGGHSSVAWLRHALEVPEILEELGYAGDALANTTLWIWHSVMSAITVTIRSAATPEGLAREELDQLAPAPAAHAALIDGIVRQEGFSRAFFGFQVDKIVTTIVREGATRP